MYPQVGSIPSIDALTSTTETSLPWGREPYAVILANSVIAAATVDAGSTPTTVLRPGLALGIITSSGKFTQYSPTATDGSQVFVGILTEGLSMLNLTSGSTADMVAPVMVGGLAKASSIIGFDNVARRQATQVGRFIFDDDVVGRAAQFGLGLTEEAHTSSYTVVAGDNGKRFTTLGSGGSVVFTLPAIAAGLSFEFINLADQSMTITSPEGTNVVWDNSLGVTSLAFSTASHKIGGRLLYSTNDAGTKWYVRQGGPSTCTVTAS